jgi:hypothetical protein
MAGGSTEQLVDVADIKEGIVILKNGSLRAVIEVSAINFELRSEEEQMAIIQNYQRFLNSIDFPLQIVINSRNFNIENYIKLINDQVETSNNELVKIQGLEYIKFIKELSELANIMWKRFYVVLPFFVSEGAGGQGVFDSMKGVFSSGPKKAKYNEEQFQTYRNQLLQRVELIYDGLVGLGVKTRMLEKDELVSLYYGLYNHDTDTKFKDQESK